MVYVLLVVEKFKKGTEVREIGTYKTKEQAEQRQSETNWAAKRSEPYIVEESQIAEFTRSHQTGIFAPAYTPPTQEEIKAEAIREKEQESFEKQRKAAEEGDIVAQQIMQSKYGIQVKPKGTIGTTQIMTPLQLEQEKARAFQQREIETKQKQKAQAEAQAIAQKASEQQKAAEIIKTYRQLPQEYQNPETLKSIAEASAQRQQQEKDLKAQEDLKGRNELGTTSGTSGDVIRNNPNLQNNKGIIKSFQESFDKRTQEIIEKFQESGENFSILPLSEQEKHKYYGAFLSLGYLGSRAFGGASNLFVHPVESIKGVFKPSTYVGIYKGLKTDPYGTSAELGGALLGGKIISIGIGKFYEASPVKLAVEIKEIPIKEKVTETAITVSKAEAQTAKPTATITTFGIESGRALSVLKAISEEKPPTILGNQYYGFKEVNYGLKATEQITTPKYSIIKPSNIVTSEYQVNIPKPSVSIAEATTPKTTRFYITIPSGTQYTTTIKGPYFIRSVTEPTGATITKVFKGDTLLKTLKQESTPSIKFTEPLEQLKTKEYLSMPELRMETEAKLSTSKGISTLEKGKYEPTGARIITTKDLLKTQTKKMAIKTLSKPVIDLETGKVTLEPKMIEILPTKYKYIKYLPEQKPIIKTISEEGVYIEKPAISKTTQITPVRDAFIIKFKERISKTSTKVVETITKKYEGTIDKNANIKFSLEKLKQKGMIIQDIITETIQKLKKAGVETRQAINQKTKKLINVIEIKKDNEWIKTTKFKDVKKGKMKGKVSGEYVTEQQDIGTIEVQRPMQPITKKELNFFMPSYETKQFSGVMPFVIPTIKQKPTSTMATPQKPMQRTSDILKAFQEPKINLVSMPKIMQDSMMDILQEPKIKTTQITKPISKTKSIMEIIQEPMAKVMTQQIQMPQQKQILKQMQELAKPIKSPMSYQSYENSIPRKMPILPSFLIPAFSSLSSGMKQGYAAFIKRKGVFEQVSPVTSEEAALDIGARKARTTLAATVKIMPTEGPIQDIQPTGYFQQFKHMFRHYKISHGQKMPLPKGEYIQEAKTRLGTREEVAEIKQAKMFKGKSNFAFGKGKKLAFT